MIRYILQATKYSHTQVINFTTLLALRAPTTLNGIVYAIKSLLTIALVDYTPEIEVYIVQIEVPIRNQADTETHMTALIYLVERSLNYNEIQRKLCTWLQVKQNHIVCLNWTLNVVTSLSEAQLPIPMNSISRRPFPYLVISGIKQHISITDVLTTLTNLKVQVSRGL